MKLRLFTPDSQETLPDRDETPVRPSVVRGAHAALALIAVVGIGVSVVRTFGSIDRDYVAGLATERVAAYSTGLLYLLAAATVHALTFLDVRRAQPVDRRAARWLLAAHDLVALAVLYSFAVQRLTSRALLVGLDPLLSSTAILSVLACVVALAMVVTHRQPSPAVETHNRLPGSKIFFGICLVYAASILWLEWSPLP